MPQKESTNKGHKSSHRGRPPSGDIRLTDRRHSGVSNRMARFKFAFEEKIPTEIWRQIERLPPSAHRDLLVKSMSEGILPLHDEQGVDDKFVVYLEGDTPKHFGRIDGKKVRSKWGRGRILNHGLWDVPLTYGSKVKYSSGNIDFTMLKKILDGFKKYGKSSKKNL